MPNAAHASTSHHYPDAGFLQWNELLIIARLYLGESHNIYVYLYAGLFPVSFPYATFYIADTPRLTSFNQFVDNNFIGVMWLVLMSYFSSHIIDVNM